LCVVACVATACDEPTADTKGDDAPDATEAARDTKPTPEGGYDEHCGTAPDGADEARDAGVDAVGNGPPPPTCASCADIEITMTASPSVTADSLVTFTVTVTNHGPATASSVQPAIVKPASFTFIFAELGCQPVSGTQIFCNLSPMTSGETKTRTIKAKATTVGTFVSSAAVFSANDPNPSNDKTGSATTLVSP
jgi:uncharacterized repeat protein (TIGR01451 family)